MHRGNDNKNFKNFKAKIMAFEEKQKRLGVDVIHKQIIDLEF